MASNTQESTNDEYSSIHSSGYILSDYTALGSALSEIIADSSQARVEDDRPAHESSDPTISIVTCPKCGHQFSPSEPPRSKSPEAPIGQYLRVPQRPYKSRNAQEWDSTRREFVRFTSREDFDPMPLSRALRNDFSTLEGRDEAPLNITKGSISIRLEWPGYLASGAFQVKTHDWTVARKPITKSKLGYEIAKGLNSWIKVMEDELIAGGYEYWKVGPSGITLDSLYLGDVNHVSKGSWQPDLYIRLEAEEAAPV